MKKDSQDFFLRLMYDVANLIFERGAFQIGEKKSKAGDIIPYYLNLRDNSNPKKSGPLKSKDYNLIALCLNFILLKNKLKFDAIAGIPYTGQRIINAYANIFIRHKAIPRVLKLTKEEKEDGSRKIITHPDFKYKKHQRILLVDDVIHKATSSLEAIEALNSVGCVARDLIVVIDLEQGGKEILEKKRCRLHPLFRASELLPLYFRKCLDYLENRQGWL